MATTMVSYDIDGGHHEVKRVAFQNGFYNLLATAQGNKQAPNTILLHDNISEEAAIAKFEAAVATAALNLGKSIRVEKVIAVAIGPNWRIRSDQPAHA